MHFNWILKKKKKHAYSLSGTDGGPTTVATWVDVLALCFNPTLRSWGLFLFPQTSEVKIHAICFPVLLLGLLVQFPWSSSSCSQFLCPSPFSQFYRYDINIILYVNAGLSASKYCRTHLHWMQSYPYMIIFSREQRRRGHPNLVESPAKVDSLFLDAADNMRLYNYPFFLPTFPKCIALSQQSDVSVSFQTFLG